MCVSILIYMYKESINLKITLLDYPALILQRWWACLKHRKPITWPLSSWCLWESAPRATKEGQSGNKLREAEKVQSAIKCVWTGFPCAFTMFRMLRDNFLKVHFKLNLHFFPIKKKKKDQCLSTHFFDSWETWRPCGVTSKDDSKSQSVKGRRRKQHWTRLLQRIITKSQSLGERFNSSFLLKPLDKFLGHQYHWEKTPLKVYLRIWNISNV